MITVHSLGMNEFKNLFAEIEPWIKFSDYFIVQPAGPGKVNIGLEHDLELKKEAIIGIFPCRVSEQAFTQCKANEAGISLADPMEMPKPRNDSPIVPIIPLKGRRK